MQIGYIGPNPPGWKKGDWQMVCVKCGHRYPINAVGPSKCDCGEQMHVHSWSEPPCDTPQQN